MRSAEEEKKPRAIGKEANLMKGSAIPVVGLIVISLGLTSQAQPGNDPLPSWNDTAPKKAIIDFVERVTTQGSPDFVKPEERIATFDNDGTLWAEKPIYFQFQFAIDRVKALARQHPEWNEQPPFNYILTGDMKALIADGKSMMSLMALSHAGMTTDDFNRIVKEWLHTAKHPKTGRLYTQMVYQPMLELLTYLRANGFETFIVSGGGVEFMRCFAEQTYGIPAQQVVGSSSKMKYEIRDGKPVLLRLPEVQFVDDKQGKPIGIETFIGRRPIAAFGNSDGDQQMLEWTMGGSGARFVFIVHHDDAEREWAYDRKSDVGRLDKAWDEAMEKGWPVVSMRDDWKTIFPKEAAIPSPSASR